MNEFCNTKVNFEPRNGTLLELLEIALIHSFKAKRLQNRYVYKIDMN